MKTPSMSGHQFALCRLVLGLYLCVHFLCLLPVGVEVFSHQGMLSDAAVLPTWGVLPNLFWISDSPLMVYLVLVSGVGLALALAFGVFRQAVSFFLWGIWMSLFNRNILISNPSLPYIGLLLLLMAALPQGEPFARGVSRPGWHLPQWVYLGFFVALMGGYTASGLHKLNAPSWVDGTAFHHVLSLPIARDSFLREWMLQLPSGLLKLLTWSALAAEILALPLIVFRRARPWIWLALVLMNCAILLMLDFADLTFGILVAHLFCFSQTWLAPSKMNETHPVVFFDGVCGLCNHLVDFVLTEDTEQRFHFATIQSETAKEIQLQEVQSGESMAIRDGEALYTQSDAALQLIGGLGGHWRVCAFVGLLFPRGIRNIVYFQVQKHRYRIFGKRDTCRLPTPEERARFLP